MSNEVERGRVRSERPLYAAVFFTLVAASVPVRGGASDSNPTAASEWALWQD